MSDIAFNVARQAPPAHPPVAHAPSSSPSLSKGGEPDNQPGKAVVAGHEVAKTPPIKPLLDEQATRERLEEAVRALNDQMERNGRGLKFSIDEEINRHIITVRNTLTGEVVRQIPTEVAVRVAHSIEQLKGLLSDETA